LGVDTTTLYTIIFIIIVYFDLIYMIQ
jgi:hypothetical protein